MLNEPDINKDILDSLNETRLDNVIIYDKKANRFMSFPDRMSVPNSMFDNMDYCVIDRSITDSKTLDPYRCIGKQINGNVAEIIFSVSQSKVIQSNSNRCVAIPTSTTLQTIAEDEIKEKVERILTNNGKWTTLISGIGASSSVNGSKFNIIVTVTAVSPLSNDDLYDFIESFNMFPRRTTPMTPGIAVNCSWNVFVTNINNRIASGSIVPGQTFSTTISGTKYNVTF